MWWYYYCGVRSLTRSVRKHRQTRLSQPFIRPLSFLLAHTSLTGFRSSRHRHDVLSACRVSVYRQTARHMPDAAVGVLCRYRTVSAATHPESAGGVRDNSFLDVGGRIDRPAHVHVLGTFCWMRKVLLKRKDIRSTYRDACANVRVRVSHICACPCPWYVLRHKQQGVTMIA